MTFMYKKEILKETQISCIPRWFCMTCEDESNFNYDHCHSPLDFFKLKRFSNDTLTYERNHI